MENQNAQYYLAHKDLCLYPNLKDLIKAGVSSFKIEGRMRSGEQLAHIIRAYRQALNNYMADPLNYLSSAKGYQELQEQRVRDYSSGNLWRAVNYEDIGLSGEREPYFPTAPIQLKRLDQSDYQVSQDVLPAGKPELTVAVGDPASLQTMLDMSMDNIILGLDNIRQRPMNWNAENIKLALDRIKPGNSRILIETPRIVSQQDLADIYKLIKLADSENLYGFIVNDLGSLRILRAAGLRLWAGYGLNISNVRAAAFLQMLGVERVTASLEIKDDDLEVFAEAKTPGITGTWPITGIISDLCIAGTAATADQRNVPWIVLIHN